MAKVKKNLSLEKNIVEKANVRATELGYNFSAYVTHLINMDCMGKNIIIPEQAIAIDKEEPKKDDMAIKDEELLDEIDNIMDNM